MYILTQTGYVTAYTDFAVLKNDFGLAEEVFGGLLRYYKNLEAKHKTKYGLFYSEDDRDGMEYSISGNGLRPTINSYMYANALAIAKTAKKLSKDDVYSEFLEKSEKIKTLINTYLWDDKDKFYKNIPMSDEKSEANFSRSGGSADALEEIGYIPWMFEIADEDKDEAFKYLMDPEHFYAPFGPTTADKSHSLFMKNDVKHECLWDGPSWPYATAQTLSSVAERLRRGKCEYITEDDFIDLFKVYTASHYITQNGKKTNWIDENLDPVSGKWLARDIIINNPDIYHFPKERGANYNHSTYCDIVLSYVCGINFGENKISVNPLCKNEWDWFSVTNIHMRGKEYSVFYDKDGAKYGFGRGIAVFENGKPI